MVKSLTRKDLKRRPAFKPPNKAELIVCEGSKTETAYFKALRVKLRLPAVCVIEVVSPCQSRPIDIVNYAIDKKRKGLAPGIPYSKVWCIVDVEISPHGTLEEAWEEVSGVNDLELILTNPFIEYWFLLHFNKIDTPFRNKQELFDALKEVHPTYRKSHIGFDILEPLTNAAINNSKEVLREKGYGNDLRNCNPSTHVHIVVEHLQRIAPS